MERDGGVDSVEGVGSAGSAVAVVEVVVVVVALATSKVTASDVGCNKAVL